MKIAQAYNLFLLDCQIRRLKSRSTSLYQKHLKYFFSFCTINDVFELEHITAIFIKSYSLTLISKSVAYQRNLLSSVNLFLSYCQKDELIKVKPKMRLPEEVTRVKPAFTKDDIKKILSACTKQRDYIICLFLLETGVRLFELISIDIEDVSLSQGLVKVRHGKTGERYVTVGVKVRKLLIHYLAGRTTGALFLSKYKKRLTISGMTSLMDRLRSKTNIQYLTCHAFRRTFGTNSLRSGMDITILARLMGHSDLQMLRNHYLDMNNQDLIDANNKFSLTDNL